MEIAKYNTKEYEIEIEDFNGTIDEMIFTVEDVMKNVIFKKTLGNGIVKENNSYILSIEPDDTKNMNALYTYKYFLEVIINEPKFVDTTLTDDFRVLESSRDLGEAING